MFRKMNVSRVEGRGSGFIFKFLIISFGLIIFSNNFADALLSIRGNSGLITMPTAFSLKERQTSMAMDFINGENDSYMTYKAALGNFFGFELGAIGYEGKEGSFINLKRTLLSEDLEKPFGMAFGLTELTSYHQASFYMVASKKFSSAFTGHFGFEALDR